MADNSQRIANKIIGMLVIFLVIALLAIGMTLVISWRLEGGAAAINDAGSLRMRLYRIGYVIEKGESNEIKDKLRREIDDFEFVLADLERGDPLRPLSLPSDVLIRAELNGIEKTWHEGIRPMLLSFLEQKPSALSWWELKNGYSEQVSEVVKSVNLLVSSMERSYSFNTNLLRSFQIGLVLLAAIGTAILIRFFFIHVIRPLDQLQTGIKRMSGNDFSVRLPLETRDEFGVLAHGFNQMVENLQSLYANLEERVDEKTANLAERNQELSVLYEITAFLNERDGDIDALCSGFLQRIRKSVNSDAGAVRLQLSNDKKLSLIAHEGLSENFITEEAIDGCGKCLCGASINKAQSLQADTCLLPYKLGKLTCAKEGFRSVSAFTIGNQNHAFGVFNLYYFSEHTFLPREVKFLESLGQNLGVAIENQMLRSRDREMAVAEARHLFAQELHDSIAQGLAFLNIQSQLLQDSLTKKSIEEAQATANKIKLGIKESYRDVRELLVYFRKRDFSLVDLGKEIQVMVERFEVESGVKTVFEKNGHLPMLDGEHGFQVRHIIQEVLANIRKHARASTVKIDIFNEKNWLNIKIVDDGVGFLPESISDEDHMGMLIMNERATRIGAKCIVDSEPGCGTTVNLLLLQK